MRNCQNCGRAISGHGRRKFCSDSCRVKNHYENGSSTVERVCRECGKTFKFCLTKKSGGKFCSVECSGKYKRSGAYEFCWHCGKSVWKTGATKEKNFCSRKCADHFNGKTTNLNRRKSCQQCGKEFTPRTKAQKYCSKKCSGMARRGEPVKCKHCKAEIQKSSRKGKVFCSTQCKTQHAEQVKRKKAELKVCPFIAKIKVVECQQCGEKFLTNTGASICSDKCKKEKDCKRSAIYHRKNPEIGRAKRHRQRARMRNAKTGTPYTAWIRAVRSKTWFNCYWCGAKTKTRHMHVDHIVALANGGADALENVCASCATCNRAKSAKPLSEWAKQTGMLSI